MMTLLRGSGCAAKLVGGEELALPIHCIPAVSRRNSSIALRISRNVTLSRCSRWRLIATCASGSTPSVRIVITVSVITNSISEKPWATRRRCRKERERKKGLVDNALPIEHALVESPEIPDLFSESTTAIGAVIERDDFSPVFESRKLLWRQEHPCG